MKKIFILIISFFVIATLLFCFLASCSSQVLQYPLQKEYLSKNDYISPYLYFETDDCRWYTGQGKLYDHNLSGNYEIKDNVIICTETYWDLRIELELTGNNKIKVLSIKDKDGVLDWLHEGDILTHFTEEPTVSNATAFTGS